MRIAAISVLTLAAFAASAACAFAADWSKYGNARFNYWIDIPPGFSAVSEAENGDGGVSESTARNAKLSVWGSYVTQGDFRSEAQWRAEQDRGDGWTITYQKQQPKWGVWSGAKGSRIFYERAASVCDGAAAYFRLEYEKGRAAAFDSIIARLGKSLRGGKC